MQGLRNLADGLWVIDMPLSVGPIALGARTTIMRLGDGGLLLVSPVKMDDALRNDVAALGPVRALAAPNLYHHLFIGQAARAWPEAKVLLPPGLQEKLLKAGRELRQDAVLGEDQPDLLRGAVETVWIRGVPKLEEIAFFHKSSRTLVLTDAAFNIQSAPNFASRAFFGLYGAWKKFGPTLSARMMIKDRKSARAALDRILAWDFDRVVVAHGDILESGGKQALRESFTWLKA